VKFVVPTSPKILIFTPHFSTCPVQPGSLTSQAKQSNGPPRHRCDFFRTRKRVREGGGGGVGLWEGQRDGMMVELELKGRYRGGVQPVRGRLNLRLLLR